MNLRLLFLEFNMLQRLPAFRISLVVLAALLIFAARHQHNHLQAEQQRIQTIKEKAGDEHQAAIEKLTQVERGEKEYASMWDDPRGYYTWHRTIISYPQQPLAFMAVGQRDLYAPVVSLGIFQPASVAGRDLANPVPRLMGTFDPAFVLVFLMPLFIIGFSQGILSREREAGTLPLLLVAGKPASLLILKVLPRFTVLTGAVILFLLVSMIATGLNPLTHPTEVLWVVGATLAYTAFWFLIAVAADLGSRSSASHAMVLIGVWALVCILLPSGISTLSKHLFPLPSTIEITNQTRVASKEQKAKAQEILAKYYEDHPELTAGDEADPTHKGFFDYYRSTLGVGFAVEGAVQTTRDRYDQQKRRQQALEQRFAAASPAILMGGLLETQAGSSSDGFTAFEDAVTAFSREWRGWFQTKAFAGDLITSDDLSAFPRFEYDAKGSGNGQTFRLGALLVIDLLLLAVIAIVLKRRGVHALLGGVS